MLLLHALAQLRTTCRPTWVRVRATRGKLAEHIERCMREDDSTAGRATIR